MNSETLNEGFSIIQTSIGGSQIAAAIAVTIDSLNLRGHLSQVMLEVNYEHFCHFIVQL